MANEHTCCKALAMRHQPSLALCALSLSLLCASCLDVVGPLSAPPEETEAPQDFPQACYEGPKETLGKGLCKAGERSFEDGPCEGQVLPAPDCGLDEVDESCDGHTGAFKWSNRLTGFGEERLLDIALLDDESAVITGYLTHTANIAGNDLYPGMFVIKFDKEGTPLKVRSFGHFGSAVGVSIAIDPNRDIWIAGLVRGPALTSFGGDSFTAPPSSSRDVIVKLDGGTLEHKWSAYVGGGNPTDLSRLTISKAGEVVVTGTFRDALAWPEGNILDGDSSDRMFVSYLDLEGHHLRSYKSAAGAEPWRVATDNEDNVIVMGVGLGISGARPDFGKGELPGSGPTNFVVKFDPTGKCAWSKALGTTQQYFGRGLAVAPNGDIAVTAGFSGVWETNFEPLAATTLDVGVAVFDPDGGLRWAKQFGGDGDDVSWDIAATDDGWVLGGGFQKTLDVGLCPVTSQAEYDAFLLRLDKVGNPMWIHAFGDPASDIVAGKELWPNDVVSGVKVAPSGDIVIGAHWSGNVSWGGETYSGDLYGNVVVARYAH